MFKDMALSRDLVTAYRESTEHRFPPPGDKGKRKAGSEDGPKATFMVLQASSWPFTPKAKDADLPPYVSNQPAPIAVPRNQSYCPRCRSNSVVLLSSTKRNMATEC